MNCEEFSELLDAYLQEVLDGPVRSAFREHLVACGRCRAEAVAADPSMLFSAPGAQEPDRRRIEALTRAVMGDIRQRRLSRRLHRSRRPWLAAAAAVVVSLAAVTGWRLLSPGGQTAPEAVAEARAVESDDPPPRLEVHMPGTGVRVYQYADQQDADTAVYFIVNPAMEL
jgi:predicted anti-sigma-YlaC factor YlaD